MTATGTQRGALPQLPHAFTDGCDREIAIEGYDDDPAPLEDLYEHFDDDSRAQGIPPRSPQRRTAWIEDLLEGHNVVAWHDGDAVGHAVLMPYRDAAGAGGADPVPAAELAVFVRPDYQSAGIGTALVRCLLGLGRSVGIERVTLVVEPSNTIAVRLYRSTGFEVTERHRGDYEMARAL